MSAETLIKLLRTKEVGILIFLITTVSYRQKKIGQNLISSFVRFGSPNRTKLEPLDDRFTNLCCYLIAIQVQLQELYLTLRLSSNQRSLPTKREMR